MTFKQFYIYYLIKAIKSKFQNVCKKICLLIALEIKILQFSFNIF